MKGKRSWLLNADLWGDLGFFLTRLRALSPCESLALPGGFCLSMGSNSASENWAFFPGVSPDEELTGAALRFFEERGVPFVWPVEAGNTPEALVAAGLRERGRLVVMSRSPEGLTRGGAGVTFHPVSSRSEARRWAQAAWRGFDGEGLAPCPFQKVMEAIAEETTCLRLVTARLHGEDVGTFLLAPGDQTMGIYYFAVLPEFRRQGVAAEMMSEAGRMALAAGCHELVLQSTPAGLPFYRNAGFTPRGEMALFSSSEDVF